MVEQVPIRFNQAKEACKSMVRDDLVGASRALLSALLLRVPPLSGERLRAAERSVARALADGAGAGAGATDLRLLLALLAARDGRFDEAMSLYAEAAREDPSDHRPKALGRVLCHLLNGRHSLRRADYSHLAADDAAQLFALVDELVVAAALGGAPYAVKEEEGGPLPECNRRVLRCAAGRAGVGLAAVLRERDEEMPPAKRLQLSALRAFLRVSVESVLKRTVALLLSRSLPSPSPR
ncbi:hypothetical protein HU200_015646 [Digitaria exilis]|uniref:Uncharacterized protein n=1 Tax=Digitaria exilis TaxID=1010633 RepID=A0A835F943_9POAL|nr:hypothetical protein HU200_015646 [Digitaria exilis]